MLASILTAPTGMSAMILDIDVGNTRLKWRVRNAGSAGEVVGRGHCANDLAGLATAIGKVAVITQVARVRVANVAGAKVATEIGEWSARTFSVIPEFAVQQAACAGVTCGYRQPATLGVDRWLGLLAAWNKWAEPCVVVDAGSALTVDLLGANGAHLGGYIVPGLGMMHAALAQGTGAVKIIHQPLAGIDPGISTLEAVNHGCGAMAVALVGSAWAHLVAQLNGAPASVVLTGGDAGDLAPFITAPLRLEPELVLDGLALALP